MRPKINFTYFRYAYSKNHSWETKQLFGDINFYVANVKCSYEPFIYFHGEVKGTLLTSPISMHGLKSSVRSRIWLRWGNPPPGWKRWGNLAIRWGHVLIAFKSIFFTWLFYVFLYTPVHFVRCLVQNEEKKNKKKQQLDIKKINK